MMGLDEWAARARLSNVKYRAFKDWLGQRANARRSGVEWRALYNEFAREGGS